MHAEIRALHSRREGLRCHAIGVVRAARVRTPDADLPADCEVQRTHDDAALAPPERADDGIAGVCTDLEEALSRVHDGRPQNPHVTLRLQGQHRIQTRTA
jgi:hypothetical protein